MKETPYISYQERRLSGILAHYGEGFEPPEGERIIKVEFFVDPVKDTVVYSLLVDKKKP